MAADYQGRATDAVAIDPVAAANKERRTWKIKALRFLQQKRPNPDEPDILEPDDAPRRMHRKKARCVVCRLDNALNAGAGISLSYFKQNLDPALRPVDPTLWPRLSLVRDEGSDMTCAGAFLKRKALVNLDESIDFNHGEWNCLKGAVREAGLWPHLLVMAVAANLDHGPYLEDRYYGALRGAWQEYLRVGEPQTCPLYEQMLPGILRDRKQEHRIGEEKIEEQIWQEPWCGCYSGAEQSFVCLVGLR